MFTTLLSKTFKLLSYLKIVPSLSSDAEISRFITDPGHFKTEKKSNKKYIHWRAFQPQKKYPKEISVYETSRLKIEAIWDIGKKYYANKAKKKLIGRGVFGLSKFKDEFSNELSIFRYPLPHFRHCNIDFPVEDSERQLYLQKLSKISDPEKM